MRRTPLYHHSHERYAFRPDLPDNEPAAWAWIDDDAGINWMHALNAELILEPGQPSPR